ncbi:hypothetical protein ACRC7T_05315 [Segnochrobactraceae bacterium EtOH-i3]
MRNVNSDIRPSATPLEMPDPLPDLVTDGFAALSEAGSLLTTARSLRPAPRLKRLCEAIIQRSAFLGHRLMIERAGLDGVIDQPMIAAERRRASHAGVHEVDEAEFLAAEASEDAETRAVEQRLSWLVGRLAALEARLARLTSPAPAREAPRPVVHAQRARLAAAFGAFAV